MPGTGFQGRYRAEPIEDCRNAGLLPEPALDDSQAEDYAPTQMGPAGWRPTAYELKPAGAAANKLGERFI